MATWTHPDPSRCPSCTLPFERHMGLIGTCRELQEQFILTEKIITLCVRERTHIETPDAIRWVVTLPGDWGDGFPTRAHAVRAVVKRARKGGE